MLFAAAGVLAGVTFMNAFLPRYQRAVVFTQATSAKIDCFYQASDQVGMLSVRGSEDPPALILQYSIPGRQEIPGALSTVLVDYGVDGLDEHDLVLQYAATPDGGLESRVTFGDLPSAWQRAYKEDYRAFIAELYTNLPNAIVVKPEPRESGTRI